jgi:predicted N-acetyltransferase YhbS
MAVHAARRREGVGRRLIERAVADLARDGVEILSVLTLGPSAVERRAGDNYAGTRAFYVALGFVPIRELELKTWRSPALMLALALAQRANT